MVSDFQRLVKEIDRSIYGHSRWLNGSYLNEAVPVLGARGVEMTRARRSRPRSVFLTAVD